VYNRNVQRPFALPWNCPMGTEMSPSRTDPQTSETFTALNGLRFLAALAVVVFHFTYKIDGYDRLPEIVKKLIHDGPAAVGFFFILSGFVLASRHLRNSSRTETTAEFYWARFIRLYPAYLVGFLLFAPIAVQKYLVHSSSAVTEPGTFALSAVLYCLMSQAWTPLAQSWNGPSWSLSVEAFMYLVFPLIAVRLIRLNRKNTILILGAAWLIPVGLACAYVGHLIPELAWRAYVSNNPLLWTPLFAIGICAAKLVPRWKKLERSKANLLSTVAFVGVIAAAVAWPGAWGEVFITGGIAPLLFIVVVSFTGAYGWITKLIGGAVFNKLGQASYIIYIIQSPVWHYWQALTNRLRHVPMQTAVVATWQFFFFVPFLIMVSLAVERFVETPVRGWLATWRFARSPGQRSVYPVEREVARRDPVKVA
jgi:peptidoglycan/LPS O-acetylase OafA/YrhL